ncbi:MAG: hypothetical protein KJ749_04000 [Planctomycetes bacterium]|nr:hypothetical protein [Planctomycetota bacterium]
MGPTLRRGFWLLMGVMHAFALFAAWRSFFEGSGETSRLIGCFTLSLSMLFFVLKVYDVSFLRMRPTKGAWVAACLLVAWIHLDCVNPDVAASLSGNGTDLLATTVLLGGLTRVPEAARAMIKRRVSAAVLGNPNGHSRGTVRLDDSKPCCWVLASRLYLLRAPPA